VDAGRPGTRSLGVPVGGAADRACWTLGNALVGNPPDAPALELAVKGPILRADAELAGAVFGAPFVLSSARQSLRAGRTFTLTPGEELHVGGTPRGMRAYLCVAGGISASAVLGSRSGLEAIQRGDTFACASGRLPARFLGSDCPFPMLTSTWTLRVIAGQQANWFDERDFYSQAFSVTPASNRMGLRIEGRPLALPNRELLSEPVCPGTVQVTRNGQCIVLGVDGQTIGGYPRIAQAIRADLDALGQMRPGDQVRFERVELAEAERLDCERRATLVEWITRCCISLAG
jgi:antagonist of KipI